MTTTTPQFQKELDISCEGIDMFMNNDWDGCEALFRKHREESPFMLYCHSYILFMTGLMRFDETVIEKAQKGFEKAEKLCNEQLKQKKVFKIAPGLPGIPSFNVAKALMDSKEKTELALEDQFNKSLIVAECKLYLATITFMKQEVTGFITGGLLIKKSWKLLSRIQKQLYDMYKKVEPNAEAIYGYDPSTNVIQLQFEGEAEDDKESDAGSDILEQLEKLKVAEKQGALSVESIKRLLGGVSFGYGLYQVLFSLTPPSLLKIVRVLGFQADRNAGIKALNFTSNSRDMRAPLADLILLGYGVLLTPMLGLSECDITINANDIQHLLSKNQTKYPKSAFFYFYRGQYLRSQKKLEECMKNQEEAFESTKDNPDIQLISIEEMSWLSLIDSNYARSFDHFSTILSRTRWYKSLYAYFCAMTSGSQGNFAKANEFIKEAHKLAQESLKKRKNFQIEDFGLKRVEFFRKNPIKSESICQFMIVEMLYLWVCYPCCHEKQLNKFLEICDACPEKSLTALKCLFEGAIQMELKNYEFGETCLNECLARMESEKMPFGKYAYVCAHYILGKYYLDEKRYDLAKTHLNKAASYGKEYEFEYHIQTLVQSSLRRVKYLTETSAVALKK